MHRYKLLLQLLLRVRETNTPAKAELYDRLVDTEFRTTETYQPSMIKDAHNQRHIELHLALDELFADYIYHHPTKSSFTSLPILELIHWSYQQTFNPTDEK